MLRVAWWLTVAFAVNAALENGGRLLLGLGFPALDPILEMATFYGVLLGVVAFMARNHLGDSWAELLPVKKWTPNLLVPLAILVIGKLVVSYQLVAFSMAIRPYAADAIESGADEDPLSFLPTFLVLFAMSAVIPPIAEEALVRGVAFRALAVTMSTRRVIVVSALFFAIIHFSFERFAHTFMAGLIYGWMFARTGSLLPGIVAHAIHNAFAFVIGEMDTPQVPVDEYGLLPAWVVWVGASLIVAGLYGIHRMVPRQAVKDAPSEASEAELDAAA